jgi:hypothetical protein
MAAQRRPDGSIDTEYYMRRAHALRAIAIGERLSKIAAWFRGKQATSSEIELTGLSRAKLDLPKGARIKVRDAAGWLVSCHGGRVWITLEHNIRDIILEAGQGFIIDRRGLTLVSALAAARIQLRAPSEVAR